MHRFARYIRIPAALIAVGALFFLYFLYQNGFSQEPEITDVSVGGQTVRAEVADTPQARAIGLSGRESLAPDEGMLFIFPDDGFHAFWMKDMRFSIDIIWLSAKAKVVDIAENVSPDTYPASFSPQTPARYVLELPAGFAKAYTVRIGDVVGL